MTSKIFPLLSVALLLSAPALAAEDTALPRFPTLHGDKIVFEENLFALRALWSDVTRRIARINRL